MRTIIEALGSKTLMLTLGGIITVLTTPGLTPVQRMEGIIALIAQYSMKEGFVNGMAAHGSDKTDAEIAAATKVDPPKA